MLDLPVSRRQLSQTSDVKLCCRPLISSVSMCHVSFIDIPYHSFTGWTWWISGYTSYNWRIDASDYSLKSISLWFCVIYMLQILFHYSKNGYVTYGLAAIWIHLQKTSVMRPWIYRDRNLLDYRETKSQCLFGWENAVGWPALAHRVHLVSLSKWKSYVVIMIAVLHEIFNVRGSNS